RVQEIGIRMALGASSRRGGRLVIGEGLGFTIAGPGIGSGNSVWSVGVVSGLLFYLRNADSLTIAFGAPLLALVALAASYTPARRAMNVDPMIALRQE